MPPTRGGGYGTPIHCNRPVHKGGTPLQTPRPRFVPLQALRRLRLSIVLWSAALWALLVHTLAAATAHSSASICIRVGSHLNGIRLAPANPTIHVRPGEPIRGMLLLDIETLSSPYGFVPSWGDVDRDFVLVSSGRRGIARHTDTARVRLEDGGRINSQEVGSNTNTITAVPGEHLQGTIRVAVVNSRYRNATVFAGFTPTWGRHKDSFVEIDNRVRPGANAYHVQLDLTAPDSAGSYGIVFASGETTDLAHLLSRTAWHMEPLWDDGLDVADLSRQELDKAHAQGFVDMTVDHPLDTVSTVYGMSYVRVEVR